MSLAIYDTPQSARFSQDLLDIFVGSGWKSPMPTPNYPVWLGRGIQQGISVSARDINNTLCRMVRNAFDKASIVADYQRASDIPSDDVVSVIVGEITSIASVKRK
jgi:hypothetical protein